MTQTSRPAAAPERQRDKERTRQEILDVATASSPERLLGGAGRRDRGADPDHQADDLLLLRRQGAALHRRPGAGVRHRIRDAEQQLRRRPPGPGRGDPPARRADLRPPRGPPDFIRLVAIENIHRGRVHRQSKALRELNTPAVSVIATILDAAAAAASSVRDVDAIDVHMVISAYCFFRVVQPAHLRRHLRPRPARPGPPGALPPADRRPDRQLPHHPRR